MKHTSIFYLLVLTFMAACHQPEQSPTMEKETQAPMTIVIHGGAGSLVKRAYTPEQEAAYHAAMRHALDSGMQMLSQGDSAVAVVEAVVRLLEDAPVFNAGKGAVFNYEGSHELDAAIMDGKTMKCGSVAGVQHIKNPISTARLVMEKSSFVFLAGAGAEAFAKEMGVEMVDSSYFFVQEQYDKFIQSKTQKNKAAKEGQSAFYDHTDEEKFGTVGCLVLDAQGNLAAGTSTGGIMNKRYGRVGDSPVIGAGTYASNATCAVSCTGHGEDFIRAVAAYHVSALMELSGLSVDEAAKKVIHERLAALGGQGGLIALDRMGNYSFQFNTEGMFRGVISTSQEAETFIYK